MPHPLGNPPSKIIAVHLNYPQPGRGARPDPGRSPPTSSSPRRRWPARRQAIVSAREAAELLGFEGEIALVIGRGPGRCGRRTAGATCGWVTAANDAGVLRPAVRRPRLQPPLQGRATASPRSGRGCWTAAELDPAALRLRTWVNGELVQDDTTDTLLFPFGELVADLSRLVTLEPGDVILTGTPAGASVVEPGDMVEVEVRDAAGHRTGRLRNPIASAGPPWSRGARSPGRTRAEDARRRRSRRTPARARWARRTTSATDSRSVAVATLSARSCAARPAAHVHRRGAPATRRARRMVGVGPHPALSAAARGPVRAVRQRHERPEEGDRGAPARARAGDGRPTGHRPPARSATSSPCAPSTRGAAGVVTDGALRGQRGRRRTSDCPSSPAGRTRRCSAAATCRGTPACRSPVAGPRAARGPDRRRRRRRGRRTAGPAAEDWSPTAGSRSSEERFITEQVAGGRERRRPVSAGSGAGGTPLRDWCTRERPQ